MASMDGFGSVSWWGFSPALDLTYIHKQGLSKYHPPRVDCTVDSDCVNVLLIGCGDLRHVLKTMALASRHTSKPVHFYMVESCLEVLARHMLFLSLLCESPDDFGLQEKAEMFLELYGNSMLRAHTDEYLKAKSNDLIKMVTDGDYCKSCLPLLDTSALKFKEIDFLQGIFKFWRSPDGSVFDITRHWETRLRHNLGVRYDSRSGVYDWDYHMKLQEMAPCVGLREYCEWRERGMAFLLREDAPYETPNKTLASGVIITQGGEKVARRGYWGDIINSPYLGFGIQSENKDLLKGQSGKHVHSSTHISNYNITSLIHKLTTGQDYTTQYPVPGQTSSGSRRGDHHKVIIEEVEDSREDRHCKGDVCSVNVGPGSVSDTSSRMKGPLFNGSCYISFLPLGSLPEMSKKAKYRNVFNIVYFSNSMVHHLQSGIEAIFAPDCTVVIETAKYMLDLNKEQRAKYETKVTSMAKALGFKVLVPADSEPTSAYLAFTSQHSQD